MTGDELAAAYLSKAAARRRVLDVLMEEDAYSDVVREAQEMVELALKACLRMAGVDPPKWHDVGPILVENAALFAWSRKEIDELARISHWLRREREHAFYGEIDLIPTEIYGTVDAERARSDALHVLAAVQRLAEERHAG